MQLNAWQGILLSCLVSLIIWAAVVYAIWG
jgi:hypothetical protein